VGNEKIVDCGIRIADNLFATPTLWPITENSDRKVTAGIGYSAIRNPQSQNFPPMFDAVFLLSRQRNIHEKEVSDGREH
jgi:hypothetical protein